MDTDIEDWSWPDHPFQYRFRTYLHHFQSRQVKDIESWLEENIDVSERLTFHGPLGDCYFKNEEDVMAFKLRWL